MSILTRDVFSCRNYDFRLFQIHIPCQKEQDPIGKRGAADAGTLCTSIAYKNISQNIISSTFHKNHLSCKNYYAK